MIALELNKMEDVGENVGLVLPIIFIFVCCIFQLYASFVLFNLCANSCPEIQKLIYI